MASGRSQRDPAAGPGGELWGPGLGERRLVIATVVLLATVALALFSLWIVTGHIVRPLDRITRAMTA